LDDGSRPTYFIVSFIPVRLCDVLPPVSRGPRKRGRFRFCIPRCMPQGSTRAPVIGRAQIISEMSCAAPPAQYIFSLHYNIPTGARQLGEPPYSISPNNKCRFPPGAAFPTINACQTRLGLTGINYTVALPRIRYSGAISPSSTPVARCSRRGRRQGRREKRRA
jgi:hypothetical protein